MRPSTPRPALRSGAGPHGDFTSRRPPPRRGLLGLAGRPTAIFAGNDLQAFGVYEAARRHGLRIPHDLSVVGFDGLPVAAWVSPPLTTVGQPLAEMGGVATQMLSGWSRPAAASWRW